MHARFKGGWGDRFHFTFSIAKKLKQWNQTWWFEYEWVWSQTHKKVKLLLIVVFQALYCPFLFNLLFFLVFFSFSFGFNFFIRSKVLNPTTISHQILSTLEILVINSKMLLLAWLTLARFRGALVIMIPLFSTHYRKREKKTFVFYVIHTILEDSPQNCF